MKALAEKLYRQGLAAFDDATDRYVLLREAREIAAQAGDVATAVAAIEELNDVFAVEGLALKAEALGKVAIAGRAVDDARALAVHYLKLIDEAVAADDYERAKSVASRWKSNSPPLPFSDAA